MTDHLIFAILPLLLLALLPILLVPARKRLRFRPQGDRRCLRLLETLALDPKRRVMLVEADGRRITLLLGGSSDIVLHSAIASAGSSQPFDEMVAGATP